MECDFCGSSLIPGSFFCNQCGAVKGSNGKWYPNKIAAKMSENIPIGSNVISVINLIRIILINVTILSALLNAGLYFCLGYSTVWAQYPICFIWIVYRVLKSLTCVKSHVLRNIRVIFYWIIISSLITSVFSETTHYLFSVVWPALLVLLDITGVILLLCKMSSASSFAVTAIINILIDIGAFLFIFTACLIGNTPEIYELFYPHIISLSLSFLLLINYITLKFVLKKGTRIWKK